MCEFVVCDATGCRIKRRNVVLVVSLVSLTMLYLKTCEINGYHQGGLESRIINLIC